MKKAKKEKITEKEQWTSRTTKQLCNNNNNNKLLA